MTMASILITCRDVERLAVDRLGCDAAVCYPYPTGCRNGRYTVRWYGLSIRRTCHDGFEVVGRRESLTELPEMIDKLAKSHGEFGLLKMGA
jgi:hypothetical protein